METRHIRLDYGETLTAKKQLLSSEINLIYINKNLSRYKALRKKEFAMKNQLKTNLTSLRAKLDFLISTFPKEQGNPKVPRAKKTKIQQEEKNLSSELEDIQTKLARLQ